MDKWPTRDEAEAILNQALTAPENQPEGGGLTRPAGNVIQ